MNRFDQIIKNAEPKKLDQEGTTIVYKWCQGTAVPSDNIYNSGHPTVLIEFNPALYQGNSYCCGMKLLNAYNLINDMGIVLSGCHQIIKTNQPFGKYRVLNKGMKIDSQVGENAPAVHTGYLLLKDSKNPTIVKNVDDQNMGANQYIPGTLLKYNGKENTKLRWIIENKNFKVADINYRTGVESGVKKEITPAVKEMFEIDRYLVYYQGEKSYFLLMTTTYHSLLVWGEILNASSILVLCKGPSAGMIWKYSREFNKYNQTEFVTPVHLPMASITILTK
jgi:hypothetical protein